jgi:hypothetical protein
LLFQVWCLCPPNTFLVYILDIHQIPRYLLVSFLPLGVPDFSWTLRLPWWVDALQECGCDWKPSYLWCTQPSYSWGLSGHLLGWFHSLFGLIDFFHHHVLADVSYLPHHLPYILLYDASWVKNQRDFRPLLFFFFFQVQTLETNLCKVLLWD